MTRPHAPADGWRTFVVIWITQAGSVFGSAITGFALTIWLTQRAYPAPEQRGELAFALAAFGLSHFIAGLIAAPIGGAWADRHDRRQTMLLSDALSGLVTLTMLLLVLGDWLTLWLLLMLNVVAGVANTFHDSAWDASYALLVPDERLPQANGMMQTAWALSGVLSPALAATLIAWPALLRQGGADGGLALLADGTSLALLVDLATFVIAVAALMLVRIPSPRRSDLAAGPSPGLLDDIGVGVRYIWQRRAMLWLLGTFTVVNFSAAPVSTLLPLLVKFSLAPDRAALGMGTEAGLALINSVGAIGGVAGGVVMSVWGGLRHRRIFGVLVPMIISLVAEMLLGLSPLVWLTAALAALSAAMVPFLNSHSQAIWQSITPNELQGRVFAVRRVIAQGSFPLGTLLAGVAGGGLDPGLLIALVSGAALLFCIAQCFNRSLRRIEDRDWLEARAGSGN